MPSQKPEYTYNLYLYINIPVIVWGPLFSLALTYFLSHLKIWGKKSISKFLTIFFFFNFIIFLISSFFFADIFGFGRLFTIVFFILFIIFLIRWKKET